MPHDFLVLCGGAMLTAKGGLWRRADRIVLDDPLGGGGGNVNLKVGDITRRLAADLPDVVADLVELATYVYCADQAARRGGKGEFEYGENWRRRFRLVVPVRRPDVWNDPGVSQELARTLGFLSDDDYEFGFVRHARPHKFSEYLPSMVPGPADPGGIERVVMFSGGLDSLGGAAHEVFGEGRRVALVSHRPVSKIDNRQRELVDRLVTRVKDQSVQPFHVSVWANKKEQLGREYTQRTRSFLFGAFGVAVATVFGLDEVRFYENGVVSLNLPVCAQVLGGRASRTTHPQTLWRMQSLFSHILQRPIRIENPFLWKTKTDVVAGLRGSGHADLIRHTVSCAHTWETSTEQPHCGKCSQCIDRKLAAAAAGLSDADDPDRRYRVPVLTGAFAGVEHQTMVERVVGTAFRVTQIRDPARLYTEYGEASRVLRYLGIPADAAARRVFELYKRHAAQVCTAVGAAARKAAAAPRQGGAADCLGTITPAAAFAPSGGESPVGANGPGVDFVPTKEDLTILRALAGSVTTLLVGEDLAARTRLSRRMVGQRIQRMLRHSLVNFPQGSRKGVALTRAGRDLVARADAGEQRRRDPA